MSSSAEFPRLLAPLPLRGRRLRNRIGFAAMTSRMPAAARVTPAMVAHLERRAAGGAAVVVTEALSATASAATPNRVAAFEDGALPGLAQLAEAVGRQGALLLGQLWHGGSANRAARGLNAVGPSATPDGMSWTVPRVLTPGEIEGMVEEYADSAARLQRAGFAGVEVSAAHGFLPLQFLSPASNRREDGWGGDAEGRSRFVREILHAIRARCGAEFLAVLKLPAEDGVPGSIGPEEAARLTAAIVAGAAPPDWLCFSQGSHAPSLWMHAPDMHEPVTPWRGLWRALRAAAGPVPIAAIARIPDPATAEAILAEGDAELVMLARPLLADPDWPRKAAAAQAAAIRPCIYCNACWDQIDRAATIGCSVNPHGGAEPALPAPALASMRRRVAVLGAGVAGMQAAAVAAERGHEVVLFGASAATGGAARLHARLPGCADIGRFLDHLEARVAAAGVEPRLGVPADAAALRGLAPDALVLATGSAMVPPDGFADTPDLRAATAALLAGDGRTRRGGLALLFDQDHTPGTYDAALLLAARFDRVVIATPRETVARDSPMIGAQGIHRRLAAAHVEVLPFRTPLPGGAPGMVRLRHTLTGEEQALGPVALFTYATPRRPRVPRLEAALVLAAGDAVAPRALLSAIREGQAAGERV